MALEGNLQDMSLADLIEIFHEDAKSGALLLNGDTESGVIYITQGRVIDAAIIRKSAHRLSVRGDKAVHLLLQWDNAHFLFRHDPSVLKRPVTVFQTAEQLIGASLGRGDHGRDSFVSSATVEPIRLASRDQLNVDHFPSRHDAPAHTYMERHVHSGSEQTDTMHVSPILLDLEPVDLDTIMQMPAPTPTPLTAASEEMHTRSIQANTTPTPRAVPGRRLLHAVMRRVRGL
jgi:hypothetical protein